jgi:hypothetical protein
MSAIAAGYEDDNDCDSLRYATRGELAFQKDELYRFNSPTLP